jgi:hypothetical protein
MSTLRAWLRGLTLDARLTLGITALITATPLVPAAAQVACAMGVVWLTVVAWSKRCRAATPVGVFCATALALAAASVPYSQLVLGGGLLAYAVVVRRVAWMRGLATWLRWGSFGAEVRVLTAASGVVAALALWGWYRLLQPNVDDIVRAFVPAAPLGVLIAGGLLFSMVNAAIEEGAYRGVLLHGLDTALGRGPAALVLQAAAFGALHVHGFPRGAFGVGLAAIFGLLMGLIRRRAGGMLAPWLAHVFTDVVIAGIILTIARPSMALHPMAAS